MSESNGKRLPPTIETLESKVDKLLIVMLEVVRTQAAIVEQQEDIVERLNNLNVSGEGFSSYATES